jgi:hypothetical protein
MNMFPIFNKNLPIPVGVEIRYEKFDAEYLMHMLYFLEDHMKGVAKGTFVLVPAIEANSSKSSSVRLIKEFEKFAEGARQINGYVAVSFLDEMRPLFEAYHASLQKIKEDARVTFTWDAEHQFFPLLLFFEEIKNKFFPTRLSMH